MPVIATAEGKGVISDRHPLSLGSLWLRNDTVAGQNSSHDLVLAVGTRLAFPMWLGGQQVVQIDVDADELGRNYDNTYGVHGDARLSLEALLAEVSKLTPARADRSAEVAAERAQRQQDKITVEPQESMLAAVPVCHARRRHPDCGHDAARVLQPGLFPGLRAAHVHHLVLLRQPGLRLPHGIGRQGRAAGQGGGGALRRRAGSCTTRKRWPRRCSTASTPWWWCSTTTPTATCCATSATVSPGGPSGAELHNPDFMKLAEAYGVNGVRAETPEGLETALRQCIAHDGPSLIEVPVGPMPTPFERL